MSDKPSAVSERSLIVISGYYGFDNLGDEAILEELISELKEFVPLENIVVLSNNPQKTAELYGVQAINRWRIAELIPLLKQARLFISGGGGLLQDATSARPVFYYGGQILAARMSGAQVLIYAQGIGPLKRTLSKFFAGQTLKLANYITLRDPGSISFAESMGLSPDLSADPVWSLKPSPLPETFKLPLITGELGIVGPVIGISLRRHALIDSQHLEILGSVFKKVFPSNSLFVMLPLQTSEDSDVLAKLADQCKRLDLKSFMLKPEDFRRPSQWLALMERFDLLIGMRLHALLMAVKAGTPVVGIPYDPKVTYLCQTAQQPLLSFEKTVINGLENVWFETIESAFKGRLNLAKQANQTTSLMQQKSCKNFDILARILKS